MKKKTFFQLILQYDILENNSFISITFIAYFVLSLIIYRLLKPFIPVNISYHLSDKNKHYQ